MSTVLKMINNLIIKKLNKIIIQIIALIYRYVNRRFTNKEMLIIFLQSLELKIFPQAPKCKYLFSNLLYFTVLTIKNTLQFILKPCIIFMYPIWFVFNLRLFGIDKSRLI